jgi:hypothetical protein
MPDLPTYTDLFRVARDQILQLNGQISQDAIEREGMDANILVAGGVAAADEVVGQLTDLGAGLYLDSATGTKLDRLVFDRYGLIRNPAAAAVGSVVFTTATPSPTTFTIPSGTVLASSGGLQYITTTDAIFIAGATGPLTVAVRSVLAGANQNATVGSIINITSQISGSPSNLAVTNTLATAGAADAETDQALRNRARGFFTTVQKGTLAALQNAALGVAGVQTAAAFEVIDSYGRPARQVQLVVSDQFTTQFANTSVVPPQYAQQSQMLAANVFNALSDVRPAGTFVQVIVAQVILQGVQLALTFQAGVDTNQVALQARAAVTNYVNSLAPGSPFQVGTLNPQVGALGALSSVPGLILTGGEIVSPAGTVQPAVTQVIRTSLGLVAAVAAQGNQPIITGSNPDAYTA